MYSPLRLLLILDNLASRYSRDLVHWCGEHGVGLLYMPCAAFGLTMTRKVPLLIILSLAGLLGYFLYIQ